MNQGRKTEETVQNGVWVMRISTVHESGYVVVWDEPAMSLTSNGKLGVVGMSAVRCKKVAHRMYTQLYTVLSTRVYQRNPFVFAFQLLHPWHVGYYDFPLGAGRNHRWGLYLVKCASASCTWDRVRKFQYSETVRERGHWLWVELEYTRSVQVSRLNTCFNNHDYLDI